MTKHGRRSFARVLLTTSLLAASVVTGGCDGGDQRTAAEIKADLVAQLLEGMKRKGSQLSAEQYDAAAQELLGVRVTGPEGVLYAARATIVVDEQTKAVRMKLFDVIVAQPVDETDPNPGGSQGQLVKYREMVLDDLAAPSGK